MKKLLFLILLAGMMISCGSPPTLIYVDINEDAYATRAQRDSANNSYFEFKLAANDSVLAMRKNNLMEKGISEKKAEEILESYGIIQNKNDRDAEIKNKQRVMRDLTDRSYKHYEKTGKYKDLEMDEVYNNFIEHLNALNQNDENIIYL
jgi:adenylate kinase family enzyme